MPLEELRSNWDILKEIITADLEAWKANIDERTIKLKLETNVQAMGKLQNDIAILSIYLSACEHYLEVMNSIEVASGGDTTEES